MQDHGAVCRVCFKGSALCRLGSAANASSTGGFLTKEQSGGHWIGCYERENVGAASVLAKQTQEQSCCAQLSPVGSEGGRAHLMSEVVCSHQFDLAGFYKGST